MNKKDETNLQQSCRDRFLQIIGLAYLGIVGRY